VLSYSFLFEIIVVLKKKWEWSSTKATGWWNYANVWIFSRPSYRGKAHIRSLYSYFNDYDNKIKKFDMKFPHKNNFKSTALAVG